jgi:hypothetical protein
MLIAGLVLLASSFVLVWLCLPSKNGEIKSFLRGSSRSEMAAAVVTACIAAGIIMTIAGIVQ